MEYWSSLETEQRITRVKLTSVSSSSVAPSDRLADIESLTQRMKRKHGLSPRRNPMRTLKSGDRTHGRIRKPLHSPLLLFSSAHHHLPLFDLLPQHPRPRVITRCLPFPSDPSWTPSLLKLRNSRLRPYLHRLERPRPAVIVPQRARGPAPV